jgi:DNA-binding SARP family transcriptional activator
MSDDRAFAEMERAYAAFERAGDRAGCLLAAIEIPGILFNIAAATKDRGKWIDRIERSAQAVEELREPDLLLRALSGLVSLYESEAVDARVPELARRLMDVLPLVEDPNLRLHALGRVAMTAWRTRRHELGFPVIAMAAEQDLARRASPLRVLHWYSESITFDSIFGDPARAAADGVRAESIAISIGLPHLLSEALLLRLEAACDSNDIALARGLLARLEASLDARRPSFLAAAHGFAGRLALLEDDAARAIESAALMARRVEAAGGNPDRNPAVVAIEVTGLALAGRYDEALEACRRYEGTLRRFDRPALESTAQWIRAARALQQRDPHAREALARAVAASNALADYHPLRCGSRLAAQLCARALEWDIEPAFIRAIVKRRRLKAPDDAPAIWPWPLRIRTLGGFEIAHDGEPVADKGRAQKSLELLQLAIALGGEQVPIERLVKALWPGEGREGAQQAFDTTLHRLRKLLGAEEALRVADRRLSIDTDLAWVDALVLQRKLKALEEARGGSSGDWRALVALYQGHFLPHRTGEAWADEARERLWGGLRRLLVDAARKSRADGDTALAQRLLYFIVDLDALAEDAIAELMRLHLARGEAAEALRVFRRCEAALASELKVQPGEKLKALAEHARGGKVSQL